MKNVRKFFSEVVIRQPAPSREALTEGLLLLTAIGAAFVVTVAVDPRIAWISLSIGTMVSLLLEGVFDRRERNANLPEETA